MLNILTHRGHCGHQYELWKLPHNFTCVKGISTFSDTWLPHQRPLHPKIKFVKHNLINPKDFDLAIVHIDEFCIDPPPILEKQGWSSRFNYFLNLNIPKIFIMHGSNSSINNSTISKIRAAVGNNLVVCNSFQQQIEWNFPNSITIYHGFNPAEFPSIKTAKSFSDRTLFFNPSTSNSRPIVNGKPILDQLKSLLPNNITLVQPPTFKSFKDYSSHLSHSLFFLNFTSSSPMPRNRAEAMLAGNITVSTPFYNWSDFIQHGKNGFLASSPQEFKNICLFLKAAPKSLLLNISSNARSSAINHFHINRFLSDWSKILP